MSVIDEFMNNVPPLQRVELERIRKIVQKTVPDAVEVISYGMPGFKYKNKYLITFNNFKDHMSIFPGALADEKLNAKLLQNYKVSKGTIQFTLDNPLPEVLIKEIVLLRAKDIAQKY